MSPGQRRHSIILAYANGGLWGLGDGLAGMTLVFYLAQSYGAKGIALSWLLAAPKLVGVLRLFTPLWMDRLGDRRRFCVRFFFFSAIALLGLPIMSALNALPGATRSVTALVICWAGYHLLMHFGLVALWSWFSDLIPPQVRGRFVGRRSAWMNAGKVLGIVLSAVASFYWHRVCENAGRMDLLWTGFATLATTGAIIMMLAVWPLSKMVDPPSPSEIGARSAQYRMKEILLPFADASFRRLLYYGAWFSFANGITDTAIRVYQIAVLQITFTEKRILDSSSRGIQAALMPWVGKQIDRRGNVPALILSQGLVAAALLFLLPASPEAKWWVIGTYALWIAYAGTNVAMPNLMLQLSKAKCSAAYAAAWFAITQLVNAISLLIGGVIFDWASKNWTPLSVGSWQLDHFATLIVAGWMLRSLGMIWAARIREPASNDPL